MKYLALTLVAAILAFSTSSAQAGVTQQSLADLDALTEDISNISIYTAASYSFSDGLDTGGALIGISADLDAFTASFEYGWSDGDVHEFNLLGRRYADFGGINPYFLLGGGLLVDDGDAAGAAIGGLGLELELTDALALFAEYRYSLVFSEDDRQGAYVGLSWAF